MTLRTTQLCDWTLGVNPGWVHTYSEAGKCVNKILQKMSLGMTHSNTFWIFPYILSTWTLGSILDETEIKIFDYNSPDNDKDATTISDENCNISLTYLDKN